MKNNKYHTFETETKSNKNRRNRDKIDYPSAQIQGHSSFWLITDASIKSEVLHYGPTPPLLAKRCGHVSGFYM